MQVPCILRHLSPPGTPGVLKCPPYPLLVILSLWLMTSLGWSTLHGDRDSARNYELHQTPDPRQQLQRLVSRTRLMRTSNTDKDTDKRRNQPRKSKKNVTNEKWCRPPKYGKGIAQKQTTERRTKKKQSRPRNELNTEGVRWSWHSTSQTHKSFFSITFTHYFLSYSIKPSDTFKQNIFFHFPEKHG